MSKFRQSFLVRLVFGWWARILAIASLLVLGARMLPAWFPVLPYLPDLVALTPWFILVDLLALVLALTASKWMTALILIGALALNVSWQYPFYGGGQGLSDKTLTNMSLGHPDRTDGSARVMTLNVYKGQADVRTIVQTVKENRVEVLALQEVTDDFVQRLEDAGIDEYLPYKKVSSADGKYGNGIWTATPMGSPARDDVNSRASMMPAGSVGFKHGSTSIRFISVHTTSPTPGTWSSWRDSIDDMNSLKRHTHTRYVLMGDFNSTYDHAVFRDFLGDRFQDAARLAGHGMTMTWPTDRAWVPRGVAIDHVVVDQGIRAGQLQTMVIPGSDHAALLSTLEVD
ncbi:endonuclease/exonuclease/phosphatase family protein [uncultured Bifidobacterium sp.]|uniref:endonuclease/exonuclease/phosphatase family protein n=1 Tax=uncultured Bifidobacterium sp. TaxID=165187 RepID=UPI00263635CB|nr:endonuclease/exonuclease/phosphatase family protein [uncultured Bifidobacterium sp.]